MAKLTAERRREQGKTPSAKALRNERLSEQRRQARPVPATRDEASALYAPARDTRPATAARLYRLNERGCLHPDGRPITQGEAHQAILDAMYDEDGNLRPDMA